jgi:hypothetical protein
MVVANLCTIPRAVPQMHPISRRKGNPCVVRLTLGAATSFYVKRGQL